MKRVRREILGDEDNSSDEMDDVLTSFNNQNGLWCIEIAPNADASMLGNEITETVNAALNSAKLHSQSKMMELTGGIDLDGLL